MLMLLKAYASVFWLQIPEQSAVKVSARCAVQKKKEKKIPTYDWCRNRFHCGFWSLRLKCNCRKVKRKLFSFSLCMRCDRKFCSSINYKFKLSESMQAHNFEIELRLLEFYYAALYQKYLQRSLKAINLLHILFTCLTYVGIITYTSSIPPSWLWYISWGFSCRRIECLY